MRNDNKKIQALTLTELLVVMSVMVILLIIALPVAKKLVKSLENSAGPRTIIGAALTNARAIAIREQKYAGLRFQQDRSGRQYIVLIIHDPAGTGYVNGFRAIEGKKPMALPEEIGTLCTRVQVSYTDVPTDPLAAADLELSTNSVQADAKLGMYQDNTWVGMNDTTTFSILFDVSGKFIVRPVRVVNVTANDKTFNTSMRVNNNEALLCRDESESPTRSVGYQEENSVSSFILYEKKEFNKIASHQRWSEFFSKLEKDFVNPHTGELVKK